MIRWTFSSTDRILACPAAASLPHATTPAGEAAQRGTALHAFLEAVVLRGRDRALAAVPLDSPYRAECAALDLSTVTELLEGAETVRAEWSVAYHPATGAVRDLGTGLARGYPDAPGWVHGTMDLVVGYPDQPPMLVDWKTGMSPEPAATSGQLAIAALTVSLLWGVDRITVAIAHVREDGSIHLDPYTYRAAELDAVADRVQRAWREAEAASRAVEAGRMPDTSLGPWCRWCPAASACPSQLALVRRVLVDLDGLADELEVSTPAEVGKWWAILEQVEPRLEDARAALKRAVERTGEVPLPDGRRVVAQQQSVRSIDGKVALRVLTERFGSAPESSVKMTLADIERWAKNAKINPDEALAAVDVAGAVHQRTLLRHVTKKAG